MGFKNLQKNLGKAHPVVGGHWHHKKSSFGSRNANRRKVMDDACLTYVVNTICTTALPWHSGGFRIKSWGLETTPFVTYSFKRSLWISFPSKFTFYSESTGEMWNRHIKVKVVSEHSFFVAGMNCSFEMLIFIFFCVNKINLFISFNIFYYNS